MNSIVKNSTKKIIKIKWQSHGSKDIILCLIAIKTITGTENIKY
jgi:hypothetical protein